MNYRRLNKMKKITEVFLFSFLLFFALMSNAQSSELDQEKTVKGVVDVLEIEGDHFTAQGWIAEYNSDNEAQELTVKLNEITLYKGELDVSSRFPRPDVNKALGKEDLAQPGWRIAGAIPNDLKSGEYTVSASVRIKNKIDTQLAINDTIKVISYKKPSLIALLKSYTPKIALFASLIVLLYFLAKVGKISDAISSKTGKHIHPAGVLATGVIFVFLILLSAGITGSSFGIGVKQSPFIESNPLVLWGAEQPIRSDEWLVLTPNAIAQANHIPAFPITNSNLGTDGHNMLIIGMTGVPVSHVSQIVKPATWGYYLFDLKRALSWSWLFPIFACLLSVWAVLCNLNPGVWRLNFIASLTFSSAAYVVAWSNWPAYAVLFPCIIYLTFIKTLTTKSTVKLFTYSCLLGLAFAGFVLVLYPPWQISLTYIFIAITIGKVIKDKLYRSISTLHFLAYLFAFIIAGLLLYAWWKDAHLAIQSMENTIYPGLRTTLPGGDLSFEFLLRGYTNIGTLKAFSDTSSNQSEIASFYYMLLPLLTLFLVRAYQKEISAIEILLAGAIAFTLCFMLIGIPSFLAEISLWGRVPAKRADLALGFSCLLLTALLAKDARAANDRPIKNLGTIAAASSIIWTVLVYITTTHQRPGILSALNPVLELFIFGTTLVAGFLLAKGSIRLHFVIMLCLSVITTYNFNPVVLAPDYIKTNIAALEQKRIDGTRDQVLVFESLTPSMYLLASGIKVVNGIFYYPQTTIWQQLDPTHISTNIYNRYQHLTFYAIEGVNSKEKVTLETPQSDVVKVTVSAEDFDFTTLSATKVTAPAGAIGLKSNKSLLYLSTQNGWMWFSVKR